MLRYKTKTRLGLVALYDIRPGNGSGPFLQPRSPHGALCANFLLPRPLCSRLRPDVHDRHQTSDAHHRLMPLPVGAGHNKMVNVLRHMVCTGQFENTK